MKSAEIVMSAPALRDASSVNSADRRRLAWLAEMERSGLDQALRKRGAGIPDSAVPGRQMGGPRMLEGVGAENTPPNAIGDDAMCAGANMASAGILPSGATPEPSMVSPTRPAPPTSSALADFIPIGNPGSGERPMVGSAGDAYEARLTQAQIPTQPATSPASAAGQPAMPENANAMLAGASPGAAASAPDAMQSRVHLRGGEWKSVGESTAWRSPLAPGQDAASRTNPAPILATPASHFASGDAEHGSPTLSSRHHTDVGKLSLDGTSPARPTLGSGDILRGRVPQLAKPENPAAPEPVDMGGLVVAGGSAACNGLVGGTGEDNAFFSPPIQLKAAVLRDKPDASMLPRITTWMSQNAEMQVAIRDANRHIGSVPRLLANLVQSLARMHVRLASVRINGVEVFDRSAASTSGDSAERPPVSHQSPTII